MRHPSPQGPHHWRPRRGPESSGTQQYWEPSTCSIGGGLLGNLCPRPHQNSIRGCQLRWRFKWGPESHTPSPPKSGFSCKSLFIPRSRKISSWVRNRDQEKPITVDIALLRRLLRNSFSNEDDWNKWKHGKSLKRKRSLKKDRMEILELENIVTEV